MHTYTASFLFFSSLSLTLLSYGHSLTVLVYPMNAYIYFFATRSAVYSAQHHIQNKNTSSGLREVFSLHQRGKTFFIEIALLFLPSSAHVRFLPSSSSSFLPNKSEKNLTLRNTYIHNIYTRADNLRAQSYEGKRDKMATLAKKSAFI